MSQPILCFMCKHYAVAGKCEAFPNGIPSKIFYGGFEHTIPFSGDNGIQWERDKNIPELPGFTPPTKPGKPNKRAGL